VLELFKQGVVDLEQVESFGELMVRPLAAGERVALDVSSLEEWGDEPSVRPAGIPPASEAGPERPGAEGAKSGHDEPLTETRVREPV
jgi:hypothetical protein